MGQMHAFFLLSRDEYDYWDFSKFYRRHPSTELPDDLLDYMNDSLKWITCHSPVVRGKLAEQKGLNHIGMTIIKEEGAMATEAIFNSWADLFSQGPEELTLVGAWGWIEGGPAENGEYLKIALDRDKTVSILRQI